MSILTRRCATVVLASALFPPLAPAAEPWLKLTSSHFELYTTVGEKLGREALLYFEQVRDSSQERDRRTTRCQAHPYVSSRSARRKNSLHTA
jgi:hypothetical protein